MSQLKKERIITENPGVNRTYRNASPWQSKRSNAVGMHHPEGDTGLVSPADRFSLSPIGQASRLVGPSVEKARPATGKTERSERSERERHTGGGRGATEGSELEGGSEGKGRPPAEGPETCRGAVRPHRSRWSA